MSREKTSKSLGAGIVDAPSARLQQLLSGHIAGVDRNQTMGKDAGVGDNSSSRHASVEGERRQTKLDAVADDRTGQRSI